MRSLITRRTTVILAALTAVTLAFFGGYIAARLLVGPLTSVTRTEIAVAGKDPVASKQALWQRLPIPTHTVIPSTSTDAAPQTAVSQPTGSAAPLAVASNSQQAQSARAPAVVASPTPAPSAIPTTVPANDQTPVTTLPAELTLAPVELGASTERFAEDTFDSSSSGWLVRDTPTWSAAYVDGRYRITLEDQGSLNFSSPLPPGNYQLGVDMAVKQGRAGVVFLAAKPATFYRFMISAGGVFALQLQENDTTRNLIDWTYSEHLQRPIGEVNRLRVERKDQTIHFFVNDQLLISWSIPDANIVNQYGFAIEATERRAEATFDNLVGDRVPSTGQ